LGVGERFERGASLVASKPLLTASQLDFAVPNERIDYFHWRQSTDDPN
jgi:hypothetical protein